MDTQVLRLKMLNLPRPLAQNSVIPYGKDGVFIPLAKTWVYLRLASGGIGRRNGQHDVGFVKLDL